MCHVFIFLVDRGNRSADPIGLYYIFVCVWRQFVVAKRPSGKSWREVTKQGATSHGIWWRSGSICCLTYWFTQLDRRQFIALIVAVVMNVMQRVARVHLQNSVSCVLCAVQRTVRSQPFHSSHSLASGGDMDTSTTTRRHYSLYSRCSRSLVQLRGRTVDALASLDSTYGLCTRVARTDGWIRAAQRVYISRYGSLLYYLPPP